MLRVTKRPPSVPAISTDLPSIRSASAMCQSAWTYGRKPKLAKPVPLCGSQCEENEKVAPPSTVIALQRSPPKIARLESPGSTPTARLYQLWMWPRFMVVQPACGDPSVARMVGFFTLVGVVAGFASVRPVAMRVQVEPPSMLLRYAATEAVNAAPMLVSCAE